MKRIAIAVLMMMSSFVEALSAFGQGYEFDVHMGVNMSGYADANSPCLYDMTNKVGLNIGVGANCFFGSGIELTSGVDLVMSGGKYGVLGNYIGTDGSQSVLFPEVNVRHVSIEIPAMLGYRIEAGTRFRLTPMAGFYGRYGLFSIKDRVCAEDYSSSEKWNCYQSYQHDGATLPAVKRLDFGLAVALRVTCCSHYELTIGFRRGLVDQLQEYGGKHQSLSLSVGYRF